MGATIRSQITQDRQYVNGEWVNVCSRDNFGFYAKTESGETKYFRYNDCDWFTNAIKYNEKNQKDIDRIKQEIKTNELYQEQAYEAERNSARAIGQMKREWGVTLTDANEAQKIDYRNEKKTFYENGLAAVNYGNDIQSGYSRIRNLKSKPSIFI